MCKTHLVPLTFFCNFFGFLVGFQVRGTISLLAEEIIILQPGWLEQMKDKCLHLIVVQSASAKCRPQGHHHLGNVMSLD